MNANEPAFPARVEVCASDGTRLPDEFTPGLTKREWMATTIAAGLVHGELTPHGEKEAAWQSVRMADLLLRMLAAKQSAERNPEPAPTLPDDVRAFLDEVTALLPDSAAAMDASRLLGKYSPR